MGFEGSREAGTRDMPALVRIVRSNLLFVSKEGLSAAAIDRIRRVAAFGNPDFYRAQAMRQSVYGKERVLHFDEDAGDWIGLPRGCENSVAELLATCGAQPMFEEARCEGKPIKVEFKGARGPSKCPQSRHSRHVTSACWLLRRRSARRWSPPT